MKYSFFRIFIAFSLLFLAVSCGKEGTETPLSEFKLTSYLLEMNAAGGELEVPYTIEGDAAGAFATATVKEDWLTVGVVTAESVVLEVAPNYDGEDRSGEVVLSASNTNPVTLHVVQSKVSDATPYFSKYSISVSDVKTSSVTVEITPVDASATYYCTILSKSELDKYGQAQCVGLLVNNLVYMASMLIDGVDPNVLLYQGYFNSAAEESTSMDLNDNTEYCVIAFDMAFDASGNPVYSGKSEVYKFRTRQATQVDMTFNLSMTGVKLNIKPSADYTYICGVTSKANWDEYDDPMKIAQQYVTIAKNYSMISSILKVGAQTEDFSDMIETSGEYVAYAFGYRNSTTDGGVTTAVSYLPFSYSK